MASRTRQLSPLSRTRASLTVASAERAWIFWATTVRRCSSSARGMKARCLSFISAHHPVMLFAHVSAVFSSLATDI